MKRTTFSIVLMLLMSSAWAQTTIKDERVAAFYSALTSSSQTTTLSAAPQSPDRALILSAREKALFSVASTDTHGSATSMAVGDLSQGAVDQAEILLHRPSVKGFCSMVCQTDRRVDSCGTSGKPDNSARCKPFVLSALATEIIGNQHDAGVSPFVDRDPAEKGRIPAGYTFLGQFVDHDLTRTLLDLKKLEELDLVIATDLQTREANNEPLPVSLAAFTAAVSGPDVTATSGSSSGSTAQLDLDAMYGVANFDELSTKSVGFPHLYEKTVGVLTGKFNIVKKVATELSGKKLDGFDYDRTDKNHAVADPRNNENRVIGQLQLLFMTLHNTCMAESEAAKKGKDARERFNACQKMVRWTFQSIVATDFLPRILDDKALDRITSGKVHAYAGLPAMPNSQLPAVPDVKLAAYSCSANRIHIPHEFAVAAFRLGHSLLRNQYFLRAGQERMVFVRNLKGVPIGMERGLEADKDLPPDDIINWSYFFDAGHETMQHGRPLDTLIAERLFSLPTSTIPPGKGPGGKDTPDERNLARRNILRSSEQSASLKGAVTLATGQETWDYLKGRIPALIDDKGVVDTTLGNRLALGGYPADSFGSKTPLWLWILSEAEGAENSMRLGEVGSHLVGEFIYGSLSCDKDSVLAHRDDAAAAWWPPMKAIADTGRYSMPQLIAYLEESSQRLGMPIRISGD